MVADNLSSSKKIVTVSVRTSARAHLGFMDPSGKGERPFGSVGITLDRPQTHVLISRAETLEVCGHEAKRARRYLLQLAEYFRSTSNVALTTKEAIPAHAGLGSGTQLAISIGMAYAELLGFDVDAREIATVLGRGKRSGIGIGAFQTGGVLFDAGPNKNGGIAPILTRLAFPKNWRILLVLDKNESALHGEGEVRAFKDAADFPNKKVAELCRRTMLGLLPAVVEEDFATFSANVAFLQEQMGQYFAPFQGGHYTSGQVGEVIQWVKSKEIYGVGQSSWGPTGVAFLESEEVGNDLIRAARETWPDETGLHFELASGLNRGAQVQRFDRPQNEVGGEIGEPA